MFAGPTNPHAIHIEIDDWGGVKRQHLAHDQATDDGDTQWTPQFRTNAGTQSEREGAAYGGHGGHQNGTEAQQAGLIDGVFRRFFFQALGGESEVDHQNTVFLDDANEQDDTDHGDNA